MHGITKDVRQIKHREITVWGANADLLNSMKKSTLYRQLCDEIQDFDQRVFAALGSPSYEERIILARDIMQDIWHLFPEFGPYPFLDTLSEFQFDRVFFSKYRDHVTHQLSVFLLGLSLFDGLNSLRHSIIDEIGGDANESISEFLRRWIIAAIYHDIGYVLENDSALQAQGSAWMMVCDRLNSVLAAPLSQIPKLQALISHDLEREICNQKKLWRPDIRVPKDIETDGEIDLLALLENEALRAKLGNSQNKNLPSILRRYYEFTLAYTSVTVKRPRFRDHGVASALLLLKTWRHFAFRIEQLAQEPIDPMLADAINLIVDLRKKTQNTQETIRAAAAACALHNINKEIFDARETIANALTLDRFELDFEFDTARNNLRTPLAFLLGLVDSLQDWDRPKFRAPRDQNDIGIYGQDMSLQVKGDRVWLFFPTDYETFKDPRIIPDSRFSKAKASLKVYLNPKKIDEIVHWNNIDAQKPSSEKPDTNHSDSSSKFTRFNANASESTKKLDRHIPTHSKSLSSHPIDLRQLLQENEWIVGALNFDEDLHFSQFYTRQSCQKYLPPEYKVFGYNCLIALYEDFNETYYIPKEECIRVAEALLRTILETPLWLQDVLDRIYRLAESLEKVFPYTDEHVPFAGMTSDELLQIYKTHNERHRALYQIARLPEALDRGVGTFTNYLKSYLRKRGPMLAYSPKELNRLFDVLTFPEDMSMARSEITEFHQILNEIRASAIKRDAFAGASRRALLRLDPQLLDQIMKHRNKWSFWGYHGYGSRALHDINYYIQRISTSLAENEDSFLNYNKYQEALKQAENKRMLAFNKYRIDGNHQMIFRLHSRVGIAKLFRRYIQLRNFYYLDQLITEISKRLSLPEEQIRSLLPEELEVILAKSAFLTESQRMRTTFVVHIIHNEKEEIYAGNDCKWVRDELQASIRLEPPRSGVIRGTPVSEGISRGRCKIIIRREDAENLNFRRGDLLISESTDPDLIDVIRISGGVITEAGGVTCHAAIVCRELGKPGLVGVKDLLKIVKNDDYIVLNADEGYLRIINAGERRLTIDDWSVSSVDLERIGGKAHTLSRLLRSGINVPRFFVVPWDVLQSHDAPRTPDSVGPSWDALRTELQLALEYLDGSLFLIRSSMRNEDNAGYSGAGKYRTDSSVEREDVGRSAIQYVEDMLGSTIVQFDGSIIVQEMILGDISGICFTVDPMFPDKQKMLIEVVPGGNDVLTDGRVVPMRYVVDRLTKQVASEETAGHWRGLISRELQAELIRVFEKVESLCSSPQDIEWTIKNKEIWILQSRPITALVKTPTGPEIPVSRVVTHGPQTIASIYAAYRVNPDLRLHLLRVAAVGGAICDAWIGSVIDRKTILLTLLLHDIGNIVKVDYDQFPNVLNPDVLQSAQYWKAVQANVKERYGKTDQEVTLNIAKELGISGRILDLLKRKQFVLNEETLASDDWELKICAYADQRVGPFGVLSLSERLREAKERYKGVPHASVNNPKFEFLVECAIGIERQISANIDISINDIDDNYIKNMIDELRSFVISPN